MRFLSLVLLVVLIFMVLQRCEGCGERYANLAGHVGHCKRMHKFLSGGLKERLDEMDRLEAEQQAEADRAQEAQMRECEERARKEAEERQRHEVRLVRRRRA